MGGNMGTPPAPAQPPQVNFTTTAESRGGFSNFLKSIPSTTAMTPIPPMGSSPMPPMGGNPMANIDIFNQPPTNSVMQPPMMMADGGVAGSPLSSYGDYLSQTIENTQVQPFIQEVQEMASDRFNLDQSQSGGMNANPFQAYVGSPLALSNLSSSPSQSIGQGQNQFGSVTGNFNDPNRINQSSSGYNNQSLNDLFSTFSTTRDAPTQGQAIFNNPVMENRVRTAVPSVQPSTIGQRPMPGQSPMGGFGSDRGILSSLGSLGGLRGFAEGGNVPPRRTEIMGQDHMLSYITPEEGGILKALGGAGRPGPMGIPSFYADDAADSGTGPGGSGTGGDNESNDNDSYSDNDFSDFSDYSSVDDNTDYSDPDQDMDYTDSYSKDDFSAASEIGQAVAAANAQSGKGRTNITNVGKDSNLAYSPQFAADVAQSQGLDPSVTMSPEDYSQTTQGQAAAAAQASLDQSLADTMSLANNQVQGISRGVSRGMSPGLSTAMGPSLAQDPFGLSLDIPSNVSTIGYGRGQGFSPNTVTAPNTFSMNPSSYTSPTTTASNLASMQDAMSKGTISGVTTGPEMNANYNTTLGSSPAPPGYEEEVGKPYSGYNIDAIEDFYNAPTTMTQLGMPPGMINSALSVVENMAKDQIAADLISGNYDAITDSRGNITGSRDEFGRVRSGMDFDAPDTSSNESDNPLLLTKPIEKPIEEEDDGDKPPNVIGGGDPITPPASGPVVVDSPYTSNVGDYTPVGFDAGDLNALIAQLTGVAAPQFMKQGGVAGYAEGGLINAVDNFLASV